MRRPLLPARRRGPVRLLAAGPALVAAAVLAALLPGLGSPAAAHTGLDSTVPEDGARLEVVPRSVVLTFSQAIDLGARVEVTGPAGRRTVTPRVEGARVSVPLTDAGAGRYRVEYRVVSRDGHPVTGDVTFTVASPSATTAPATGTATGTAQAGPPESPPVSTLAAAPAAAQDAGSGAPLGVVLWIAVAGVALAGAAVAFAARRRDS